MIALAFGVIYILYLIDSREPQVFDYPWFGEVYTFDPYAEPHDGPVIPYSRLTIPKTTLRDVCSLLGEPTESDTSFWVGDKSLKVVSDIDQALVDIMCSREDTVLYTYRWAVDSANTLQLFCLPSGDDMIPVYGYQYDNIWWFHE